MPEPAALPRASIVVLNYNGGAVIGPCLRAVESQRLEGGFEVIVVDNQSNDGSADLVRREHPGVTLVEPGANLGFTGGNNLGIARARGEFVVLLNNDTRVREGWLGALVAAAESDPRVGAVTAKLVFADQPGVIQNAGTLLLSDGSGADRGYLQPDTGQFETREEVFGFCGAAALLRRAALDDVGTFDDSFFLYYEDTDLSWRMRLRGWRIVYEPKAVVEHVHAHSSVEGSRNFIFHADRNRMFMVVKDAPPGFALRALAGFYWRALRHAWETMAGRGRAAPDAGAPAARHPARARIHVDVARSFLAGLPGMLAKRRRIRGRRTASDAEILRFLYPRRAWDAR